MHLKTVSAKWRPSCLSLNVLTHWGLVVHTYTSVNWAFISMVQVMVCCLFGAKPFDAYMCHWTGSSLVQEINGLFVVLFSAKPLPEHVLIFVNWTSRKKKREKRNLFKQMHFKMSAFYLRPQYVNSSHPSATHMRQWTGSALLQVMACRLFGAKPSPEAVLNYCQLYP